MHIRPITIEDYGALCALWNASLTSSRDLDDSREAVERYLRRNPGTSVAAVEGGKLVGSVLCGHDGRRGYLYHVAVDAAHRRGGVGQAMVRACLAALRAEGIHRCALIAFTNNGAGNAFWAAMGFEAHEDFYYRDRQVSEKEDAA